METNSQSQSGANIVVIGGGAGGLGLAIKLAKRFRRSATNIILIDQEPTHLWKPLLHEVATGSLDGNYDEVRYVALARKYQFKFILARAEFIDAQQREIHLQVGSIRMPEIPQQQRVLHFEQLVIAVGSIGNDFGTPGVSDHAILLDSRAQAEQFHQSFVAHLHRINNLSSTQAIASGKGHDREDRNDILDIVIIGGGATGVELAADLHRVTAQLEDYGFESFPPEKLQITLLEGAKRLLGQLPQRISKQVEKELSELGVKVVTKARVVAIHAESVETTEKHKSDLTVWAAGIRAPEFLAHSELETDAIGRIMVKPTLNIAAYPDIFAIGDCAHCDQPDASVVPPRAQSAHQMSACAYRNIISLREQRALTDFSYHDFGSLVSLSDYSTIGNLMGNLMRGSIFIEGFIARIMYRLLYRRHQLGIHGFFRTGLIMIGDMIYRVTRSRIKLH